jgi:hypothetical protein
MKAIQGVNLMKYIAADFNTSNSTVGSVKNKKRVSVSGRTIVAFLRSQAGRNLRNRRHLEKRNQS